MKLYTLPFLPLFVACGATPPNVTPSEPQTISNRFVTGGDRVVYVEDLNSIAVVPSGSSSVRLGECTDFLGNPLGISCEGRDVTPDSVAVRVADGRATELGNLSILNPSRLSSGDLSHGDYREFVSAVTLDTQAALSAFGSGTSTTVAIKRFQIVYQWSQSALVRVDSRHLYHDLPAVVGARYGFAARMIFDAEIRETEATLDLNLGPAQLDAALALGVSRVSVRYQMVGANTSLLPQSEYSIDSAAAMERAIREFQEITKQLDKSWREECLNAQFDIAYTEIPTDGSVDGICAVRPALLSYEVRGHMIGHALTIAEEFFGSCVSDRRRRAAQEDRSEDEINSRFSPLNCEYDALSWQRCLAEYGSRAEPNDRNSRYECQLDGEAAPRDRSARSLAIALRTPE